MRRSIVVPMLFIAAMFLSVGVTNGSESDELREKAKMVKKEAAERAKAGRGEEAEKLARKAAELMEAAERLEGKGPKGPKPESAGDRIRVEKFRGLLKDMVDKERRMKESGASEKDLDEIRERIAKAKAEFAQSGFPRRFGGLKGPGPFGPALPEMMAKLEETGRRIKHLRTAAENLREAGADDLARDVMEKAEQMEREAREAKMRFTKEKEHPPAPKMGPFGGPLLEMRQEIDRLRAELNELRQRVKELEQAKK